MDYRANAKVSQGKFRVLKVLMNTLFNFGTGFQTSRYTDSYVIAWIFVLAWKAWPARRGIGF